MGLPLLERIIIEPSQSADSSVIWLHGLGASGSDFSDVIPMLNLPKMHRTRFVFPEAPIQAVTINGGAHMPAWYDISHIDLEKRQDAKGIEKSEERLRDLILQEQTLGIPVNKIILMGFSQGGAVAIHTALRYMEPLAGVGVLSSYLPMPQRVEAQRHTANLSIPIFMAHGAIDPVVPFLQAQRSRDALIKLGYEPVLESYPMEHSICSEECQDLGRWLQACLYPDHK